MFEQHLISAAVEHVAAVSRSDWRAYRESLAPECTYEEKGTDRRLAGADAVVRAVSGWKQPFSDLKGTVTNRLAVGNMVVLEVTWEGTFNGLMATPFGTLPPTGRRGSVDAVLVYRFRDGLVVEARHYFDLLTVLAQTGAMPQVQAPVPVS